MKEYQNFDEILLAETKLSVSANDIVSRSEFCVRLILDQPETEILSVNEQISRLEGKSGLYHLWIESADPYEYKENEYRLLCVYVGKGIALNRLKDHIKKKWKDTEILYISFYECENRISKYLEQLFLDTFCYHLNTNENAGEGNLYAYWDDHRFHNGTETQAQGDILMEKYPNLNTTRC